MKIKIHLLIMLILLCACGSKKENIIEKQKEQSKVPDYIEVEKDYIKINVPTKRSPIAYSTFIDSVFIPFPGFTIKSKPLFAVQDSQLLIATSKSDRAYVLNLNSMKVFKEYKMRNALEQTKKADTIQCNCALNLNVDLQGIDFYTNSSIILQTSDKLTMINLEGEILDSIVLKPSKYVYTNLYEVPVDYNPITNKIYVYKYCYSCKEGSADYYSNSFEVGIDADSKEMIDENLKYPEIYSWFGLAPMEIVSRTSYKNYQYITFFPDHRIYAYNTLNKQITVTGGQSVHTTGQIWIANRLETDFEKMLKKTMGNDVYFQLVYDDVNKKYYRLFVHLKKENPSNDKFIPEYYIQIFDQNFSLQDEVEFKKFGSFYFSSLGKLYSIVLKEDGAMFYRYTFDKQ